MPGRLSDSASVCTFLEVARVHPVSVETESEHLDALSAQVCVGERVCVCVLQNTSYKKQDENYSGSGLLIFVKF